MNPAGGPDLSGIMAKYGYKPPAQPAEPASSGTSDWYSQIKQSTPSSPSAPSFVDNVNSDLQKRATDLGTTLDSNQSAPSKVLQTVGQGAGFGADILSEGIKSAVSKAPNADAENKALAGDPLVQLGAHALKAGGDMWHSFQQAHPEIAGDAGAIGNIISLIPGLKAGEMAVSGAKDSIESGMSTVHDGISSLLESKKPSDVVTPVEGVSDSAATAPASLSDQIKASLGKNNIDPRLETSARRLEDPSGTYAEYAKQAKISMADVKADSPISTAGEHIGDAYQQVIKTRQAVGANMAEELAKVKDTPVDLSASFPKFEENLKQSGLTYDSEHGQLIPDAQSKMTSLDRSMVSDYVTELNKLGAHPTAGELDAFLSRIPQELDLAKAGKNVTSVTNAERLIKGNLSDIRTSLTTQPGMEAYAAARKSYANLSDFLDEGSRYLGAKTQSGDYARDTSIAKSSAESILAGGKKDWLIKLEGLTGYKALDDATMAIQAMKDAGDMRGLSLFKSLTEGGGVPTPHGVLGKLTNWGAAKAAGAIVGSPAEQTQAFLDSLSKTSLRDGKSLGSDQAAAKTTIAGSTPMTNGSVPKTTTSSSDIN